MWKTAAMAMAVAVAVAVVLACQRLQVPTSLGYLLVGVILGLHTVGPPIPVAEFEALAGFGVVFLLFTIGLNFSLPQLHALRHQALGRGTGHRAGGADHGGGGRRCLAGRRARCGGLRAVLDDHHRQPAQGARRRQRAARRDGCVRSGSMHTLRAGPAGARRHNTVGTRARLERW